MPALVSAEPAASEDFTPAFPDRRRRIRVGPAVTVVFEDRSALWLRIQELTRAGHPRAATRRAIDRLAAGLSGGGRLVGSVLVAEPGRRPGRELAEVRRAVATGWAGFRSDAGRPIPGTLLVGRSTDPLVGLTLTLAVPFAATDRAAFADPRPVWRLVVEADGYCHASDPLGWAVRAGLLDDLGEREA